MRLPKPTPALVVSLTALFFALGGTAFAVGSKSAPQPRCAQGAVRGIAVLDGGEEGFSSLPSTWNSAPGMIQYQWSCGGGQVLIRKPRDQQGIDVEFANNPAQFAIVQSVQNGIPSAGSVTRQSDGSFRIAMGGSNTGVPGPWQFQWDVPFTIILF